MSGIIIALLFFLAYLFLSRLPAIQGFRDCYLQAYQVFDDRGLLLRTSDTNVVLCTTRKEILIRSAQCFDSTKVEKKVPLGEQPLIIKLGQLMARGNKSFDELVETHNQACDVRQRVQYDPRIGVWF